MKAYSHRGALHGTMTVPGGKAHTIRSVMLGPLAGGIFLTPRFRGGCPMC